MNPQNIHFLHVHVELLFRRGIFRHALTTTTVANTLKNAYNKKMYSPWETPRSYIQNIREEIMATDGSAKTVALSFMLGSFLALLPTFGFGAFIGMLLLIFLPRLHKPALLSAFVIWNPFVQIPLYSISIFIGAQLFSGMPVVSFDIAFLDHAYNITRRVLVGNLIVTTTLSLVSYVMIFALIRKLKKKPIFNHL